MKVIWRTWQVFSCKLKYSFSGEISELIFSTNISVLGFGAAYIRGLMVDRMNQVRTVDINQTKTICIVYVTYSM